MYWLVVASALTLALGSVAACSGGYTGDNCASPFAAVYTKQCNYGR
jgi:hypothetical protein